MASYAATAYVAIMPSQSSFLMASKIDGVNLAEDCCDAAIMMFVSVEDGNVYDLL